MNQLSADGGRWLRILQFVFFAGLILYFGKAVFIPLSFSLLIAFTIYPTCKWLEKKKVPRATAVVLSISLVLLFILALLFLLIALMLNLAEKGPQLKAEIMQGLAGLSVYLANTFSINEDLQHQWVVTAIENSSSYFVPFIRSTIIESSLFLALMVLIPVFSALILYYRHVLVSALFRFLPGNSHESILEVIKLTISSYFRFIKGMVVVYIIVGLLNSLGLLLLGIPNAFLFGFLVSVMTFIPYVGIVISSLLPVSIAWFTYHSVWYPLGVVGIFMAVQYIEANIIFPVAVGKQLKINSLILLIMILIGGVLWGAAGMILFVPLTSVLKLIADRNDKLKGLSILLGDGKEKDV
ncbi:MAG: putative transport protein YhhT [Bacteroidia bacterium]|nr:putative transport protein YhhT [Bacteroidia bacterium]